MKLSVSKISELLGLTSIIASIFIMVYGICKNEIVYIFIGVGLLFSNTPQIINILESHKKAK